MNYFCLASLFGHVLLMAQKQLGLYAERIGPIHLLQPDTNPIGPIHYVIVHQLYSKLTCIIQIYGNQCSPSIIEQCINQTLKNGCSLLPSGIQGN